MLYIIPYIKAIYQAIYKHYICILYIYHIYLYYISLLYIFYIYLAYIVCI
nr:MAG TPA: hypothetical protein [Caudoviricetes sp.]